MTHFRFPYQIDPTGRTATANEDQHVQQLILSLLSTIPGERVNRPNFGSAAHNLVFTPNSPAEATTVQYLLQSALQQWLGNMVYVEAVVVQGSDATLQVTIQYVVQRTQQRQVTTVQIGDQS